MHPMVCTMISGATQELQDHLPLARACSAPCQPSRKSSTECKLVVVDDTMPESFGLGTSSMARLPVPRIHSLSRQ